MAEPEKNEGFSWDDFQDTLFGLGGLAVSYKEAQNKAPEVKKDLPLTPQQQQALINAQTNNSTFLGIDFSKPTNIIFVGGGAVIAFLLLKD